MKCLEQYLEQRKCLIYVSCDYLDSVYPFKGLPCGSDSSLPTVQETRV